MTDSSSNTATVPSTEAVNAAALAKVQEAQAKQLSKVRENAEKYPHAMVGKNAEANKIACTLRWDAVKNKYQCQIKCSVTGQIGRWVYTSDLFQVNMCEAEAAKAKKAKKAAAKATAKQVAELLKTNPGLVASLQAKQEVPTAPSTEVSTPETAPVNEDEGDEAQN